MPAESPGTFATAPAGRTSPSPVAAIETRSRSLRLEPAPLPEWQSISTSDVGDRQPLFSPLSTKVCLRLTYPERTAAKRKHPCDTEDKKNPKSTVLRFRASDTWE